MESVHDTRAATSTGRRRLIAPLCILFAVAVSPLARAEARESARNTKAQKVTPHAPTAPNTRASAFPSRTGEQPSVFYSELGPWGKLRYFYIYLEAPKALVDDYPLPNPKPRWSFPESTLGQLPQFFKDVGLPESFRDALLDPANQSRMDGMIHLFPPIPEIEAMNPATRALVYGELRKFPINEYHAEPLLITTETVEEFYRTSKLRPELVGKIREMSYRYGNCLAFSDLPALISFAGSESEARLIIKSCTRTRSLMVHLELEEGTDLEPLLEYWSLGLGLRRKDLEPIMQSILDTRGVERLGLAHILPAQARKLLYTYPGPEFVREGIQPDCHWTSLNFFNYSPQNYLLSERLATSTVLEKFTPVRPPYRYGDILFYLDSETGSAQHSCVYLADDIVFTKNGRNAFQPWVILKLDEVNKLYLHDKIGRIQAYRHKDAGLK
jgi:hypothetical protein